ncbi:conserved domain protein [Actinomyces sp. oral taxon 170 str. F0386]|nr:conserved domain protein [Actinomyces sp. oral taxon 170 str. F0386]
MLPRFMKPARPKPARPAGDALSVRVCGTCWAASLLPRPVEPRRGAPHGLRLPQMSARVAD